MSVIVPSMRTGRPSALHAGVAELPQARRFDRLAELSREVFPLYQGLIYIAPIGAVVRAIAPCIRHKTVDPAVVAVDVGGRWAVSLLSGHEGGANELAMAVANILDAEPVISTTTEAVKDLIVGVGCRRGAAAGAIVAAIREALSLAGCDLARVRLLASAQIKADEPGLLEAARRVGPALAAGVGGRDPAHGPGIRAFRIRSEQGGPAGGRGARGTLGRKEDAITTPQTNTPRRDRGDRPGKLYVVGIGPGGPQHRTLRAVEAIAESRTVVGYTPYLEAIADLTGGKELVASGMTHEVERCRAGPASRRGGRGRRPDLLRRRRHLRHGRAGLRVGRGRKPARSRGNRARRNGRQRRRRGPGGAADAGLRRDQPERPAGFLGSHPPPAGSGRRRRSRGGALQPPQQETRQATCKRRSRSFGPPDRARPP